MNKFQSVFSFCIPPLSFLQCKPEYKVAGLYVVDSIVRQSRHQFGADKDVFGPRFTKNITGTFENLCHCPVEDRVITWIHCDEYCCSHNQYKTGGWRILTTTASPVSLLSYIPLQSKIVRVLNLWQKNGVFKIEVIQPLLDMAAGSSSAAALYTGADEPGNLSKCFFFLCVHVFF